MESLNKKHAESARYVLCRFWWHARYTAVAGGLVLVLFSRARGVSSLAIVDYRVIWSPPPLTVRSSFVRSSAADSENRTRPGDRAVWINLPLSQDGRSLLISRVTITAVVAWMSVVVLF